MRIVILGGNGFIGTHLSYNFLFEGHNVLITSRKQRSGTTKNLEKRVWDGKDYKTLLPLIEESDIIINLVGENIATRRWTLKQKDILLAGRVNATRALAQALTQMHENQQKLPAQVIQISAIGYYGYWDDKEFAPLCDETRQRGKGFLAHICEHWEDASKEIEKLGIKRVIARLAPVMGKQYATQQIGGFLANLTLPFKWYLGAVMGTGKQPFSWVHIEDVVDSINFIINNRLEGIYNITSPKNIDMATFTSVLALEMEKPLYIRFPTSLVNFIVGDMAKELFLNGQKAIPQNLTQAGYSFKFAHINEAIKDTLY